MCSQSLLSTKQVKVKPKLELEVCLQKESSFLSGVQLPLSLWLLMRKLNGNMMKGRSSYQSDYQLCWPLLTVTWRVVGRASYQSDHQLCWPLLTVTWRVVGRVSYQSDHWLCWPLNGNMKGRGSCIISVWSSNVLTSLNGSTKGCASDHRLCWPSIVSATGLSSQGQGVPFYTQLHKISLASIEIFLLELRSAERAREWWWTLYTASTVRPH